MNFKELSLVDKVTAAGPFFYWENRLADGVAPVDHLNNAENFGKAEANYVRLNHSGCDCKTPQARSLWVNSQTGEVGRICMHCKGKVS